MKLTSLCRVKTKTYGFEIPEQYNNTLYIANASLFQVVGYFVYRSYQAIIHELVEKTKNFGTGLDEESALAKVKKKIKQMEYCDQFVDFNFPVRRAHGGEDIVRAMRVYHGAALNHGIALGGFRLVEDLRRHNIQGYAANSTYRNACYGLDFMGAHGGLKICKDVFDPADLKEALQTFAKKLSAQRGFVDIIEPDLYCGPDEMAFLHDASENSVLVMGKSTDIGGVKDYGKAGAKAAVQIIKMFLENTDVLQRIKLEGSLKGKKFIVHGLGNTGKEIAQLMCKEGATCVGVRDVDCVLYDSAGIPVKALLKHQKKYGSFLHFSTKAKEMNSHRIFIEPCDILILASSERAISCHVAENVQAKVIVEACGGPSAPATDKILTGKSKLIIPSLICGGGYSLMSYLEYLRSSRQRLLLNNNLSVDETREINNAFEDKIDVMVKDVLAIEKDLNLQLDFRTAAYIRAIRRIFDKLLENEIAQEEVKERLFGMQ